jgi:hypothetical protein
MIDEMAFNFWTCSKCLSLGHETKDCKNLIRCKACYRYGHIKRNCQNTNQKGKQCWVPKRVGLGHNNIDTTESSAVSPPLTSSQSAGRHNPTPPNPQPPPPMAVYAIDPTPWVPNGQHVLDGGLHVSPELTTRRLKLHPIAMKLSASPMLSRHNKQPISSFVIRFVFSLRIS